MRERVSQAILMWDEHDIIDHPVMLMRNKYTFLGYIIIEQIWSD